MLNRMGQEGACARLAQWYGKWNPRIVGNRRFWIVAIPSGEGKRSRTSFSSANVRHNG